MHVHILNKVWDHKPGDWGTHRGSQLSMLLSIGGWANMQCKVAINTCTDACTHSNQGMGTEMRWLGHQHQVANKLCIRGGPYMGSQVNINSCTDACMHSKQGMEPQAGWLGHTHSDTQEHPTFLVTIHRRLS